MLEGKIWADIRDNYASFSECQFHDVNSMTNTVNELSGIYKLFDVSDIINNIYITIC